MNFWIKSTMNKNPENQPLRSSEGILLVDKPRGKTSFSLVAILRKTTGIQKIGHAGTLDPFATGVMIMLIGKPYTRLSDQFLGQDKEYEATLRLGVETDTFDSDGKVIAESDEIPSLSELEKGISQFQGTILQTPPMFSAKKIHGKKLYELARKGIEVERKAVEVKVSTELLSYTYPYARLRISCSKGTYIRSIAHDLGTLLGCYAHLEALTRLRSGPFLLKDCLNGSQLFDLPLICSRLLSSKE